MSTNLIPFLAVWSAIALSVIVLLVMRKIVASKEDDQLHVLHGAVADQITVAGKLEKIDKWGKILTAMAVVLGLALGGFVVYSSFTTRGL
jgi:energy-converting hydrogenase Eha subunit H